MADFDSSSFSQHTEELDFLAAQGFPINPLNKVVQTLDEVWNYQQEIQNKRESFAYPIDGLVVKLNDNEASAKLGVVGKTPRSWCAIKFPAEEKTTILKGVTWQVGRTGKITPVTELEPVEIAGTTVQRATLHNYKEFLEKKLHLGDTLVVRKAGDIIPEVVQVLTNLRPQQAKSFTVPRTCPSCGASLVKSDTEVDLICPNSEKCRVQIVLRLSYFAQRSMANISGLSDKIIERFIDEFGVNDIADLYDIDWEKVSQMEGFGEKSASNLRAAIEASRQQKDYRFLAALGIDGVGVEIAKLIVKHQASKSK